jgi:hypothetical protein
MQIAIDPLLGALLRGVVLLHGESGDPVRQRHAEGVGLIYQGRRVLEGQAVTSFDAVKEFLDVRVVHRSFLAVTTVACQSRRYQVSRWAHSPLPKLAHSPSRYLISPLPAKLALRLVYLVIVDGRIPPSHQVVVVELG